MIDSTERGRLHRSSAAGRAGLLLIALFFGAALQQVSPAQDSAAPPGGAPDPELTVEFQRLLEQYRSLRPKPLVLEAEIREWRESTLRALEDLIPRLAALGEKTGGAPDVLLVKALCHARRADVILDERRQLDVQFRDLRDSYEANKTDDLSRQMAALSTTRSDLATRTAAEFAAFSQTLRTALERAEALDGQRESSLIRGVVLAQSAIVQDRAIESAYDSEKYKGRPTPIEGLGTVDMLALLSEARQRLGDYLKATPPDNGLEWIRGQFYLAVVEFRGSLKVRKPGEEYFTEVDPARIDMFRKAQERFSTLADPRMVLEIVSKPSDAAVRAYEQSTFNEKKYGHDGVAHFYAASANLYLGLIAAVDPDFARFGENSAQERRNAALPLLKLAKSYDEAAQDRAEDPIPFLTAGMIQLSYVKVTKELDEALKAVVQRPRPLNDMTLSFGMTPFHDSNVRLLGRNTETPLDKRRERDFRVGAFARMSYVVDLDAFDPDNNNDWLRRWQLLVEGRTLPTWNARIHDFNEQVYGGTVNLRYEILGAKEQIKNLDALYFHARYDYDYFLLGNDGFLRNNRVRPSFQAIGFDQVVDTSVFFSYEDRNYMESLADQRFDRDGNYFSWGTDTILDLRKWVNAEKLYGKDKAWCFSAPHEKDRDYVRPLQLSGGVEFTTNSTQGYEFDYASQIMRLGAVFPLPYGIDFSTRAMLEWQNYRGGSLIDRQRRHREDFIQDYAFRLERRFFLTQGYDDNYLHINPFRLTRVVMTVFGEIAFTIDDSTVVDRLGQGIYEYNRILYSMGARFDIN